MRVSVLSIALAITVVMARPARADDVELAAQVHLDRGVEAFQAGQFRLALRELTAANELVPHKPNPYRWLALTEIQLGDCPSALVHIDGFLARVQPGDERIAEMTRWQILCKKALAPAAPRTAPAPTPQRRPITRRWWFWTAIGVATIGATAVVIGVTRDDGPTLLPPIRCDDAGCSR